MPGEFNLSKLTIHGRAIAALEDDASVQAIMADSAKGIARAVNAEGHRTNLANGRTLSHAEGTKVVADDSGWHLLEYGTIDLSPMAPFRHGVEAAGARFKDGGGK